MKRSRDERESGNTSNSARRRNGAPVLRISTNERDYDDAFPDFRKPAEIGFFSHDSCRKFQHDRSQLKFLHLPPNMTSVSFNLRDGYEKMIRKDDSVKEYIDDLLKWILQNTDKFALGGPAASEAVHSLHTDFVCWRGLLTKVLCSPYENRDDWLIGAVRFRGTLYLCEFDTPKREQERLRLVGRQLEMCCWGWKFEQYLTKDRQDGMPDTSVPVNNNEDASSVVRSRLGLHSIVFAGEVDAVDPGQMDSCKYVEMKTTREIETPRQNENFARFKLIKWWAQSYLIGIPRIISGFRDDNGIVHRLEDMNVAEMPKKAQSMGAFWKPNVCFNFLNRFLQFVKDTVTDDDPRTVYLFSCSPRQPVTVEKCSDPKFQFLPDWFRGWEGWAKA